MKRFIITFGFSHIHRINNIVIDHNRVVVIKAKSHEEARAIAVDLFGLKFCTSYTEEEFDTNGHIDYYPRGKFEVN